MHLDALSPLACLAVVLVAASAVAQQVPPTRAEIEGEMGLRSEGDLVRGQRDTVGFAVTAEQAEDVLTAALTAEHAELAAEAAALGVTGTDGVVAAVSPHDDHLYAGRVYVHATEVIRAPRVILVGVFHGARRWNLADRLVFDRFQAWHGPWGPVPVDGLRGELLAAMPAGDVVVDDAMHCSEHSLEALIPFIQHRNRDVRIVPILVPYMGWERLDTLADHLSAALAGVLERHRWVLGRDVAVLVSTDAVHYGPDFDHAPFGVGVDGYQKAVARDRELAGQLLAGPLEAGKLRTFMERLVDAADPHRYLIPWCGRFSVPFGLDLVRRTTERLGLPVPEGHFLRYGTSLSEAELPVSKATREAGLGYTAPSNLHHWVGYAALAYTIAPSHPVRSGE